MSHLLNSIDYFRKRRKQKGIETLKRARTYIEEKKRDHWMMNASLLGAYDFNVDYENLEKVASQIEEGKLDSESELREILKKAEDIQGRTLLGGARMAGVRISEDYREMLRESR